MKTIIQLFLAVLAFLGLSLATPKAVAVVPPPDGGYPNFTTAEGTNALQNLTTGAANTAAGWRSLFTTSTGSFNTGVGAGTLILNNADSNTAVGAAALLLNTTGTENAAIGTAALLNNTSGSQNTATGAFALLSNIGSHNTATGFQALSSNTVGLGNTAVGSGALSSNTIGSFNIALGNSAGFQLTSGDNNICIGAFGTPAESSTTRIGISGIQTAAYIAGIAGQTVGAGGTTCYVDNDGKLGVFLSARRFKTDIADMGNASEALLALRPVTFHYKPDRDKTRIPQFGLVAEEVAAVNPDLVTRDAKGELSTVRYEAVNAMLLNEFLKEHRKVQKLEATVADLARELRQVKAQVQTNSPILRVAAKNP